MIGEKVRDLRRKKGLSLTEFARRAGMSKSMISQIEGGNANPSVDTVRAMAAALEVPVFTLFLQDDEDRGTLVRKDERMTLSVPGTRAMRELLTPDLHRAMVLLICRLPPGESSSPSFTTHKGEECVFVLQGEVRVHLQDGECDLHTGDSFYFDAQQPHVFSNPGSSEAEFLSVITPPTIQGRSV